MTAKQLSAPLPCVVAPQLGCNHNSISPGLDQIQCKNCHRCWPQRHPDYDRLLNQRVIDSLTNRATPVTESTSWQIDSLTDQSPSVTESGISIYAPRGTARTDNYYFRYSYRDGGRVRHRHIPGGNTKSALSQNRKQEIERAIALGFWPSEIEELINSWKEKRP